MPLYRVTHATRYAHDSTATTAWQLLHLQPKHEAAQHCDAFELRISPHPADLAARVDYFGNKQHIFTLHEPHAELRITTRSLVRREEPVLPMPGLTPTVADLRGLVDAAVAADDFQLEQFRHASALVPLLPAARSLVGGLTADLDPNRTPAMAWLAVLGARFCEAFIFDREATRVSTPLAEVMVTRRGVCQDFAHLLLSCLRLQGLPAAYVSGYLLTRPPPGHLRSRAWEWQESQGAPRSQSSCRTGSVSGGCGTGATWRRWSRDRDQGCRELRLAARNATGRDWRPERPQDRFRRE